MSHRDLHGCACRNHGVDFTLPGATAHYPADLTIEPIHQAIDLHFDVRDRRVWGTNTIDCIVRGDDARSLTLNAESFAHVDVSDVDGAAMSWRYDGSLIEIVWNEAVARGSHRRVCVSYRVENPVSGVHFSGPTTAEPDAAWLAITDNETERARYWLPCVDLPAVRTTLDLRITSDKAFRIVANGAPPSIADSDDGQHTASFRLDWPCPSYLICIAVGELIAVEDGDVDGIPVAAFAPRNFATDDLKRSFGRTRAMLSWMARRLDHPYPFPKYWQVAAPGVGGAMENISLVSWDDRFVLDETLATEHAHLVDIINVHEMAHSWFGDAVVCRDFAHAWLKESWATYMEVVWLDEEVSRDEALLELWAMSSAYFSEADARYKRPIVTRTFNSSWQMYDQHLYPGGAWRLHTLRNELGDETFWRGVRLYLRRNAGRTVETDHFRHAMEEESGRSLGAFFDQWFFSPHFPDLRVTFSHDKVRGEGTFCIEQKQYDEKAGTGEMHFDLELGWVAGGAMQTTRVRVKRAKTTCVVPMATAPEQVRVDPGARTLHRLEFNPGDDLLRTQLLKAADVIGRIQAGHELAKTAKRNNIEAIAAAWPNEPSWGVRARWATALGESQCEAALEALRTLVQTEQHAMVLEPLLRAAARFRDRALVAAVEARLDAGLPYRATMAAYELLGAQRAAAPVDRLIEASHVTTFSGYPQSGALLALAATRRRRVFKPLLAAVAPGAVEGRVRPAALAALASAAAGDDSRKRKRRAFDAISDGVRSANTRERNASIGALRTLEEPAAIGLLAAIRPSLPVQERVAVDRVIDGIRAAQPAGAQRKEIEALHDRVRKLEDRLEKLEARPNPRSQT